MSITLVVFISVSILQTVVFAFTLVLIRSRTQKPLKPSVTGYTESAAIKIAELEGQLNQLRLGFAEVIDRLEKWTKRDSQREVRAEKKAESILPTDSPPTMPGSSTSEPAPGAANNDQFAKLRALRGY